MFFSSFLLFFCFSGVSLPAVSSDAEGSSADRYLSEFAIQPFAISTGELGTGETFIEDENGKPMSSKTQARAKQRCEHHQRLGTMFYHYNGGNFEEHFMTRMCGIKQDQLVDVYKILFTLLPKCRPSASGTDQGKKALYKFCFSLYILFIFSIYVTKNVQKKK